MTDTKYCQECGQELRSEADFCDRCGATQQPAPEATTEPAATASSEPPTAAAPKPDSDEDQSLITRRRLFIGGGVIGGIVLGLFGVNALSGSDFRQADDAWSNTNEQETSSAVKVTTDLTLPEGRFAVRSLSPTIPAEYEYSLFIQTGNRAEVMVMDRSEFDRYRDQENISHYSAFYDKGTQPAATGELSSGDYVLVVDNTPYNEVQPDGEVRGEMELIGRL